MPSNLLPKEMLSLIAEAFSKSFIQKCYALTALYASKMVIM